LVLRLLLLLVSTTTAISCIVRSNFNHCRRSCSENSTSTIDLVPSVFRWVPSKARIWWLIVSSIVSSIVSYRIVSYRIVGAHFLSLSRLSNNAIQYNTTQRNKPLSLRLRLLLSASFGSRTTVRSNGTWRKSETKSTNCDGNGNRKKKRCRFCRVVWVREQPLPGAATQPRMRTQQQQQQQQQPLLLLRLWLLLLLLRLPKNNPPKTISTTTTITITTTTTTATVGSFRRMPALRRARAQTRVLSREPFDPNQPLPNEKGEPVRTQTQTRIPVVVPGGRNQKSMPKPDWNVSTRTGRGIAPFGLRRGNAMPIGPGCTPIADYPAIVASKCVSLEEASIVECGQNTGLLCLLLLCFCFVSFCFVLFRVGCRRRRRR